MQLTVGDLINTSTDLKRLLTSWVQAGAFKRYEALIGAYC